MDLTATLEKISLDTDEVLNVFVYGSRVYGTNTLESDWDLLIIINNDSLFIPDQLLINNQDLTIISLQQIKIDISNNNIQRLELLWAPPPSILINKINLLDFFVLDLNALRISVATVSTKCLAYAKILWLRENDIKKGKKNLFHCIRYVCFGIQIAINGMITNYTEANQYFNQIFEDQSTEWKHYNDIYGKKAKDLYKYFLTLVK